MGTLNRCDSPAPYLTPMQGRLGVRPAFTRPIRERTTLPNRLANLPACTPYNMLRRVTQSFAAPSGQRLTATRPPCLHTVGQRQEGAGDSTAGTLHPKETEATMNPDSAKVIQRLEQERADRLAKAASKQPPQISQSSPSACGRRKTTVDDEGGGKSVKRTGADT